MEIQKFLPESSFIPFQAKRLKNASVVYTDLKLFHQYNYFQEFSSENESLHDAILNEFAYIVPVTEDDHALVDSREKEFLAERYGGIGILSNGGGGRCGLIGPFQLKGIGPTPVVGQGVSFWYSHGGLALQDAMTELVYSHAACVALPNPSSRVLAIIDTGGYLLRRAYKNHVNEAEDEQVLVRRGLVLRESRLRPAHFARAFYFKPSPEVKEKYPHDHQRVADAIPLLPALTGNHNPSLNLNQQYVHAIEQIIFRAADQLSYSKARRLMHGSLTLSNLLVDGGWIDFGSVTVVPAYEQLITANLQPPFWDEFNLFQKTTADLCFYVGKFQPGAKVITGMAGDIYQRFVDFYLTQLKLLLVESAGFPVALARRLINNPHYDRLGSIFLHIARYEHTKPYISDWVLQSSGPAHSWKENSLRSVVQKLFYTYWIERGTIAPNLPFKEQFINDLWTSYSALCSQLEELARSENIKIESLSKFIGFNSTRQLFGLKQLYRGQLLEVTDRIIENSHSKTELHQKINILFEEYKALSELHYSVAPGFDLLIAKNAEGMSLFWDLRAGQYRVEIPINAVQKLCGTSSEDALFLTSNSKSYFFISEKSNVYVTYFGDASTEFLLNFTEVFIVGDSSIRLLDLFPQNINLYQAYTATFNGSTPPSEDTTHSFLTEQ